MDPPLLLAHLVNFERRVHQFYAILGRRPDFAPQLRQMWMRMADDERHHVAILERSTALLDLNDSPPQVPKEVLARVTATISAAEAAAQRPEGTADEALRHALLLESCELNSLEHAWFGTFRAPLGALLQAMTPEEETHIARLVEAVQTLSVDKALHSQASAMWAAYQQRRGSREVSG